MFRYFKIIPVFASMLVYFSTYSFAQKTEPHVYSLNALIDSAITNNFNLKAELLNDSITYTEIEALAKNYQPDIFAIGTFSYWDWLMPNKAKLLGGDVNTDMYITLTASQLIYDWGINKQKKELQMADISINKEFMRQLKQNIVWVVSQAYFDALKAKKYVAVLEKSKEQLREHLAITENLYNIGKVSNVDVLKIKVKIAINNKEINTAKSLYKERLSVLKNTTFIKSDFEIQDKTEAWFSGYYGYESRYTNDSIKNHPALKTIEEKIAKEKQRQTLYKKQNKPEVFSYAATTWEHAYIPFGANFNYNVGVGIKYTIPYWGGSSYKENILKSKLVQLQLNNKKEQLVWDLRKETDALLEQISNTIQQIKSNKKIVKLADETYTNILLQYEAGQEMIINVLDAHTILTQQSILYEKSLIDYLELLSKLNYLYGNDTYLFNN